MLTVWFTISLRSKHWAHPQQSTAALTRTWAVTTLVFSNPSRASTHQDKETFATGKIKIGAEIHEHLARSQLDTICVFGVWQLRVKGQSFIKFSCPWKISFSITLILPGFNRSDSPSTSADPRREMLLIYTTEKSHRWGCWFSFTRNLPQSEHIGMLQEG